MPIQIEAMTSDAEQIEPRAFLHLKDFDAGAGASLDQDFQFAVLGGTGESKVSGLFITHAQNRDLIGNGNLRLLARAEQIVSVAIVESHDAVRLGHVMVVDGVQEAAQLTLVVTGAFEPGGDARFEVRHRADRRLAQAARRDVPEPGEC